jgi:hypothetical protein
VQKIEDGEPLGGRVTAAAAFGDNLTWQNAMSAQGSLYIEQPVQIDPITGAPVNGGVMGI